MRITVTKEMLDERIAIMADMIEQHILNTVQRLKYYIYGVPRGGIPVAFLITDYLNKALDKITFEVTFDINKAEIIVDDIIDTGRTLKKIYENLTAIDVPFFALYDYRNVRVEDKHWLIFPWEQTALDFSDEDSGHDAVIRCLQYIGEDTQREGLLDTPRRVVKSWRTLYSGYTMSPVEILSKTFSQDMKDDVVTLRNIEFYSTCEHHMIPFYGIATIAYKPKQKVIGLSKMARLVDCYARRLQIQERLTDQIALAMLIHLDCSAVGVVIEAKHLCMMARGVQQHNPITITASYQGDKIFKEEIERFLPKGF